ncbi:MAG: class I SAM-dependent methyltransferase [Myxococcales bacterium]|nr:class I SAM-dependent methyltransferase [Myxococcales bacterium]
MDTTLYDAHARLDDEHWWFLGRRSIVRDALKRHLHPFPGTRRILDAGCGTGGNLPMLAEFGDVTGVELEPMAVEIARQRTGGLMRILEGGIPEGLPKGETFDVITMFDVLEHLDDPVGAVNALRELLSPSGQLVITVPAFQFLWSKHDDLNHHKRRYDFAELKRHLEQGGMKVGFHSYFNSLLFGPVAAVRVFRKLVPGAERENDYGSGGRITNWALTKLFSAERHVASRVPVPFGVSLLAIATRADSPGRGST